MAVSGFEGKRLVNSFLGGDDSLGTLTSGEFKLDHDYIAFLIGGGGYAGKTCVNLLVEGRVVRTATGPNTQPGGSEALEKSGWDVRDLAGRTARLQIVDDATGGWGHINLDQIVFTDTRPAIEQVGPARELVAAKRYLHFPVQSGARKRQVTVAVDGQTQRAFEIELADGTPQWWAPLEIGAWKGQTLRVTVDRLPADSQALAQLDQSDGLKAADELYREPLRGQFHFSARRGWLNDPNGLVFAGGKYHLFFQHNPYGCQWGNMHWGHAVSADLVHWQEWDEALYPDALGPMFSGSAVVDRNNTSGFGTGQEPPLVLIYTAAGNPTVQCLAYSNDGGRTFTKYSGNPVLEQITPGNRDPKVLWHEPTHSWVMSLYVERAGKHTIQFFSSPNLKQWTPQGTAEPFFECPDLFVLPLDGDRQKEHWVLTAASSEYQLGSFDGHHFKPESPKLPGHRGAGFYAAQTYSSLGPQDDRQIQIGWLQAQAPAMPFNQCMSVPLELRLRSTAAGPRLSWQPVKELEVSANPIEHVPARAARSRAESADRSDGRCRGSAARFCPRGYGARGARRARAAGRLRCRQRADRGRRSKGAGALDRRPAAADRALGPHHARSFRRRRIDLYAAAGDRGRRQSPALAHGRSGAGATAAAGSPRVEIMLAPGHHERTISSPEVEVPQ